MFADVSTLYEKHSELHKEDVDTIFDWLKTQPHLPEITELQVILFLHACYWKTDEAQKTIDNYFTFRTTSILFKDFTREMVERSLNTIFVGFLPKRTKDGYAILFSKLLDERVENFNELEINKTMFGIMSLYFHQHGPANGLIIVSDVKGFGFRHMLKSSMTTMKQMIYFMQEASPIRIKSLHQVNSLPITEYALNVLKPFIRNDLFALMRLHSTLNEAFYKDVSREYLPDEYGGSLGPLSKIQEENKKNIFHNWDFFQWHSNQMVDESKRIKEESKGFFQRFF